MSVALRCPNCGTTSTAPGECNACHEAQVRYFCSNHTPGLWLDGPACAQCGALFGEAARRSRPPAPAIPSRPRALAPARVPSMSSPPPAVEDDFDARPRLVPLWQKLLRDAARARDMARSAAPSHETRSLVRGASGCVMRVVLLLLLLFVALVTLLVVFGGALLQGFF